MYIDIRLNHQRATHYRTTAHKEEKKMNDLHGLLLMLIGYFLGTLEIKEFIHGTLTIKDDEEER